MRRMGTIEMFRRIAWIELMSFLSPRRGHRLHAAFEFEVRRRNPGEWEAATQTIATRAREEREP